MRKTVEEGKLEIGQTFPLTIRKMGINGEGVGFFKRQVVFVPGALPGEVIVAEVINIKNGFAEAKIKRIREKSPHRIEAPCPVYDQCGGCQLQHVTYEEQLRQKRDIVIQSLERYSGLNMEKTKIHDTIGMETPWNYRNKSQLQVGKQDTNVIAGLYGLNSHRIIDISDCMIQHAATNKVTQVVKALLRRLNIPIYNEKKHSGIVRTIVVRVGVETGEVQLVLVTAKNELPKKEIFIRDLRNKLPELKSIMQNVNGKRTSIIFGDDTHHLAGEEVIQETLGDLSFELSARAFFQLNPTQTVKLYDEVKKAACLTGTERVVDAYCGVGTIGLWLAKDAKEVRGMEVIRDAVLDARKNAANHGFTNMEYKVGTAERIMPLWVKEGWKPDVVVVDPPRTGCEYEFIETVLKVAPKRIVYVSCNPSTLAKDIKHFSKKYNVEYVQPLDMFPHTAHVEVVVKFTLKK
ncbi:23S rRNA (uracil(1939)-C(5))-methyltransferase RlmD [Priestia taiwanensis]|uniref:tRNA (Uracil-5-)-methyltransferase n=1 Tax=Priestia taiwanensis TaxID=1347902 RepID=A0A917AVA3_9BACI|nr:23S rRNA (uracil(1939)-C(5))-methyltransferase RlmD [Priestia taiwanensis]MBM7364665.1 tRNA (uracil-5-)-methyltransferase/23S rRNA (uracil1939-C5)-methyltransferase [Priestia taiwanensis]GGE78655.1 tRNA (uracil-5-)-methyltransferase [Priestia taiwanensis]